MLLLLFLLLIYSYRLYIVGIIYPWPFVIWIVPVLISAHYRFGLQRKVLGRVRVDMLLGIGVLITLIPAPIYGVAMLIRGFYSHLVFQVWDMMNVHFSLIFIIFLSLHVAILGSISF